MGTQISHICITDRHTSSYHLISSVHICAYLCKVGDLSQPEVGVKYWSPYVFVAGPISWLGLIKAQASSQRMIHNNPWGSVGDQWGIPREITSDSKGIPRGFPFLQRFDAFRCVSQVHPALALVCIVRAPSISQWCQHCQQIWWIKHTSNRAAMRSWCKQ